MKRMLTLRVGIILVLLLIPAVVNAEDDAKDKSFASTARQLRKVWKMIDAARRVIPPGDVDSSRKLLSEMKIDADAPGNAVASYLVVRVMVLSDDAEDDIAKAVESSICVANAPEMVLVFVGMHADRLRLRFPYEDCLARLLPASIWRRHWDARQMTGVIKAMIKPPAPSVPALKRKKMIELAASLEDAGLDDLAWRAWAEAAYTGFIPPWIRERGHEGTWLCPQSASCWFRAAECARRAGKGALAWDCLMKAAVFGDNEISAEALAAAGRWVKEKPGVPRKVAAEVKRKALTKAVDLYCEMNVHPRAWALVDANRDAFADAKGLRKRIEDGWLDVVRKVAPTSPAIVVMYGHQVFPAGDPLAVTVPPAFSDDAMTEVRKRLAELEKREDE